MQSARIIHKFSHVPVLTFKIIIQDFGTHINSYFVAEFNSVTHTALHIVDTDPETFNHHIGNTNRQNRLGVIMNLHLRKFGQINLTPPFYRNMESLRQRGGEFMNAPSRPKAQDSIRHNSAYVNHTGRQLIDSSINSPAHLYELPHTNTLQHFVVSRTPVFLTSLAFMYEFSIFPLISVQRYYKYL